MLQNEGYPRTDHGQVCRPRHLAGENLEIETPAIVRKLRDVALQDRIAREIGRLREAVERVFVPMELHPNPANGRLDGQCIELLPDILGEHVGISDDRDREGSAAGGLRHEPHLIQRPRRRPVRLHVDGFGNAFGPAIGKIFLDRIIAPDRLMGTENARLHRSHQPGQIGLPPDVEMRVANLREAARASPMARIAWQSRDVELASPSDASSGRMARRASVSGRYSGSMASGVNQSILKARAARRCTARIIAEGSPRSSPSESTITFAPRA